MAQAHCGEVQEGLSIRERADDAGSASDFSHDPFQRVVGPELVKQGSGRLALVIEQVAKAVGVRDFDSPVHCLEESALCKLGQ